MYVTYITVYSGDLLPKYYIGSTSLEKALSEKYFGSVKSKKWKKIFTEETKFNRHLFELKILSYHQNRKNALQEELRIQIELDVVKSSDYMNESLATVNGFFGMNCSGKNSPSYGKKASEKSREKMSNAKRGKTYDEIYGKEVSEKKRKKMSESMKGKKMSKYSRITPSGKLHPFYGKKHTAEALEKIAKAASKTHKGKKISEEQKKILSEKNSGNNHPRYKNIDTSRVISLIDSGLKSSEVSEILGISKSYIEKIYKKIIGHTPHKYKKLKCQNP